MESSYRARLIEGYPEAQEDSIWELSLVQMCGMTLLNRLAWDLERALQEDRKRGIASIRQRTLTPFGGRFSTILFRSARPR